MYLLSLGLAITDYCSSTALTTTITITDVGFGVNGALLLWRWIGLLSNTLLNDVGEFERGICELNACEFERGVCELNACEFER